MMQFTLISSQTSIRLKACKFLPVWLHGNALCRTLTSGSFLKQRVVPVFSRAPVYQNKTAIIDGSGPHSYASLYRSSLGLAARIRQTLGSSSGDLQGERVSFLCANDASYTVAQWATWMCGGTAVPLYGKHPASELEYIVKDSQSSLLLAGEPYGAALEPLVQKLDLPCIKLPPSANLVSLHDVETKGAGEDISDWTERPAMIIYTSGTTGRPKGVLHTHSTLQAMVRF